MDEKEEKPEAFEELNDEYLASLAKNEERKSTIPRAQLEGTLIMALSILVGKCKSKSPIYRWATGILDTLEADGAISFMGDE